MTIIANMCTQLFSCPLCTRPSFNSLDSLRIGLVSVATRPLTCPICNDTLLGIDKLTIHLFGHTIAVNESKDPKIHSSNHATSSRSSVFSQWNSINNVEDQAIKINVINRENSLDESLNSVALVSEPSVLNLDETTIWKSNELTKEADIEQQSLQNIITPSSLTVHIPKSCNNFSEENKCNQENLSASKQSKYSDIKVAKEKTERCNICGFNLPNRDLLILHKQLVHLIAAKDCNVRPEDLLKNYPCHLCTKVFKMRGSLMVHMRVAHTGGNLGNLSGDKSGDKNSKDGGFNCPLCGKNFKKEQHVTQHLKTHEGKQWECDVCTKMFTTKYFLKKHKRLHSGEMPYKCSICDKTFTFQQSYHKHRLYHKDDKPHTCTICGKSFKELSTLHNHERIHTGEKPFACETCGKCFRQRVSYLVHRRIHTGAMPYTCLTCGKSFRYKVSQRTHKCLGQLNSLESHIQSANNPSNDERESVMPI